jgi:hypothetical protein
LEEIRCKIVSKPERKTKTVIGGLAGSGTLDCQKFGITDSGNSLSDMKRRWRTTLFLLYRSNQ